jgi:hypothetical protein
MDMTNALPTLDPATPKAAVEDAKSCKAALAWVTLAKYRLFAESRPSISDVSSSRVRIEAGTLFIGVLPCQGLLSPFSIRTAKDAPRQFPSKSRTSPRRVATSLTNSGFGTGWANAVPERR